MDRPGLKENSFILYKGIPHLIINIEDDNVLLSDDNEMEVNIKLNDKALLSLNKIHLQGFNFLFKIINATRGREHAYIGSIITPIAQVIEVNERENDDGEYIREEEYILVADPNRRDIDSIYFHIKDVEILIRTRNSENNIKDGDIVRLVKKNKFTKSKKINIGDKFLVLDIIDEKIMVDNNGKILYIDKKLLRCLNTQ